MIASVFESIMMNDFWLSILRFLGGSTLLCLSVLALEHTGLIKNLQLRAWLWKLCFVGTIALCLSSITPIFPANKLTLPAPTHENLTVTNDNRGQPAYETSTTKEALPINSTSEVAKPLTASTKSPLVKEQSFLQTIELSWLTQYPLLFLLLIWLSAAGFFLSRLFVGYYKGVNALGERKTIPNDSHIYRLYSELCSNAKLSPQPALTQSSHTATPVTLLNGEICLPAWANNNLHSGEIKSLLAHELGHVKNRDLVWLLGTQIISCVFFFQPLLRLARNRLIDVSEYLADQWALEQIQNSNDVANALINCAHKVSEQHVPRLSLAMTGRQSRLRSRIEVILKTSAHTIVSLSTWKKSTMAIGLIGLILATPHFQYSYAQTNNEKNLSDTSITIPLEKEALRAQAVQLEQQQQTFAKERTEVNTRLELEQRIIAQEQLEVKTQAEVTARQQAEITQLNQEQSARQLAMQTERQEQSQAIKESEQSRQSAAQETEQSSQNTGSFTVIRSWNGKVEAKWVHNGVTETINWNGDIGVNDAEDTITSLDRNGYFEYRSRGLGPDREIIISNRNNKVDIDYKVDGQTTDYTEKDKGWFHDVLVRFFRNTGEGAEERVERLLRRDGIDGVITELPYISSDRAYRIYATTLLKKETVNDSQYERIVKSSSSVSSDSEMGKLVNAIIQYGNVKGSRWDSLITATLTISSDSEMRQTLEAIVAAKPKLNQTQWTKFFNAADTISSDSEARRLLEVVSEKTDALQTNPTEFLNVAGSISSDSECRRLLENIASHSNAATLNSEAFFRVVEEISSDSEMKRLLRHENIINNMQDQGWENYFAAAKTISSDSNLSDLLIDVIKSGKLTTQGWKLSLSLIDDEISSSSAKGRALKQVSKTLPDNNELHALYNTVVANISSRSERERLSLY